MLSSNTTIARMISPNCCVASETARLRINDVALRVEKILLQDSSFYSLAENISFDFDEGEGEIKAIN